MSQKPKIPPEEKILAVEAYLNGKMGFKEACRKYEIDSSVWRAWVRLYKTYGPEGLMSKTENRKYANELKALIIAEYISGGISTLKLCEKYAITSHSLIQRWIKRYNGQKGFQNSNSGSEIYMTKGRQTTLEERIEIVGYCLENSINYGKAVEKYRVSYQQIYSWVQKYKKYGIDGLSDKRGKRKKYEEMTEIGRLQAEVKILEAENKRKDMEIAILKKVQEVERRRS